jgi:hypothetical protein
MNAKVTTTGAFPRCVGTHTVVLYDPSTGHVHHLHHALIFEGPRPAESAMEATARRNATHDRFAPLPANLSALHLHDTQLTKGPHRVDLATRQLVSR